MSMFVQRYLWAVFTGIAVLLKSVVSVHLLFLKMWKIERLGGKWGVCFLWLRMPCCCCSEFLICLFFSSCPHNDFHPFPSASFLLPIPLSLWPDFLTELLCLFLCFWHRKNKKERREGKARRDPRSRSGWSLDPSIRKQLCGSFVTLCLERLYFLSPLANALVPVPLIPKP